MVLVFLYVGLRLQDLVFSPFVGFLRFVPSQSDSLLALQALQEQ